LVNDAPILLLDEPTSDLDRQAEKLLVESLQSMSAHKTIVVVTHSPAVLNAAKGIVVMDRGRVVTAGPTHDILPKLGISSQGVAGSRHQGPPHG
jgi:ABC-type bacteriocin/lantibiotic exporter with double-glycine peptidase domain